MSGLESSEVKNCNFSLLCTMTWQGLRAVEGEVRIRFCGDCKKLVHLCTTAAEVKLHSQERHCVAIKVRGKPRALVGDISHYDG